MSTSSRSFPRPFFFGLAMLGFVIQFLATPWRFDIVGLALVMLGLAIFMRHEVVAHWLG